MPTRFETSIRFEVFGFREDLPAEVIVREQEMVIDLPRHGDSPAFLVRGRLSPNGRYWSGRNEALPPTRPVNAIWSLLDSTYVGLWTEEGVDYYFKFEPT